MTAEASKITDQAIDWHLRQGDMDDAAWRSFVEWLDQDPAHAAAYDAVALDMSMVANHPEIFPLEGAAQAAEPSPPVERRKARKTLLWGGSAVMLALAASMAFVILPSLPNTTPRPYAITTKPGERRQIALVDGTRIDVNGASRLELDHANPRVATLHSGEATFHVRHDPRDPFVLHSGALTVQDVGTVFNVERDGHRLDVQVAEGAVVFQPKRDAVMLRAGSAVTAQDDDGRVAVSPIDPSRVGGWRNGDLTFGGEPFGRVGNALRRIDGANVMIAPVLSQRPFTGMVHLTGNAAQDVPHLANLVGANWHHDGGRWVISPR